MRTTKEKISDETNIEDAMNSIQKLINYVENSEFDEFDMNQKAIKEAARFGLQAMIDKYGYSSYEVRDVEQFIDRK